MDMIYTTEEISKILKVHFKTILNLIKRGDLTGRKVGNQWRFTQTDIDNFLNKNKVKK
jgi:excisionase family DNA binding protein